MPPTTFKTNSNNKRALLSADISATATALTLAPTGAGTGWPTNNFWITIERPDGTNKEILLIQSRSGDTLTVSSGGRGAQGVGAPGQPHSHDEYVSIYITAGHLDEIESAINRIEQGVTILPPPPPPPPGSGTDTGIKSGTAKINFIMDGNGGPLIVGDKGTINTIAGTIRKVELFGDLPGNCIVDIKRSTETSWPNSNNTLIVTGVQPRLLNSQKYVDAVLAGWNTGLNMDDVLTFTLVSNDIITKLTVVITIDKSNVAPPVFSGPTITLFPTLVPRSDPEIMNPERGSMIHANTGIFGPTSANPTPEPAAWDHLDTYKEYSWHDLQTVTNGPIDFSNIDGELEAAAERMGKFHFMIYAVDISRDTIGQSQYPTDIPGWQFNNGLPSGQSVWIPDWNHSQFTTGARTLIQALGDRYNNDVRLGMIFIGLVGNHGSYGAQGIPYPPPSGYPASLPTSGTENSIVDAYVTAFPGHRLVAPTFGYSALSYAMQNPRIGWYTLDWGAPNLNNSTVVFNPGLVTDRWKSAPVVGVPARDPGTGGYFNQLTNDVDVWHITELANGNQPSWDAYDYGSRQSWVDSIKATGYRISLIQAVVPAQFAPGVIAIVATWRNDNVAPPYHPWRVVWSLWNDVGGKFTIGQSSLDSTTLQPGDKTSTDTYILPGIGEAGHIPAGDYTLHVAFEDPDSYIAPLALAIANRTNEGTYPVGSVVII